MKHRPKLGNREAVFTGLTAVLFLAGCSGIPTPNELKATDRLHSITSQYTPRERLQEVYPPNASATLSNLLEFTLVNSPRVSAAYFDWAASVHKITVERSLPDPKLTFAADIQDVVMGLMPGLMIDLPGPGKLRAAAAVASAESEVRYQRFRLAVLQSSFELKRAYYELCFLQDRLRVLNSTRELLADAERIAKVQNEVGKVSLQDVLRAQIEQDEIANEIANMEDSRSFLVAQYKAALGLGPQDPNPLVPETTEITTETLDTEELFQKAILHNPRLREMEAEVRTAEAGIQMARRSRIPDFTLEVEADVKDAPALWTPEASISLPIWRDKIKAQIAAAQATKGASEARLTVEEIDLAMRFAELSLRYRESERNLTLLHNRLLSKAEQSVAVARTSYASGRIDFLSLLEAQRVFLDLQLREVDAKTQRELSAAELSLVIAGIQPLSPRLTLPAK